MVCAPTPQAEGGVKRPGRGFSFFPDPGLLHPSRLHLFHLFFLHKSSHPLRDAPIMESDLADIHGIDSSSSSPPSRRRISRAVLPTRVSSACERCRLHKSRVGTAAIDPCNALSLTYCVDSLHQCDPYWPCSLCVRANVDCRQRPVAQPRRRSLRQ